MARRRHHALDGEGRQHRGAIGIGERLDDLGTAMEIVAIQRFRRRPVEERVRHEAGDEILADAPGRGQRTVRVIGAAEAAQHEIVEDGAGRAGIEGNDGLAVDIGDTAGTPSASATAWSSMSWRVKHCSGQ